MRRQCPILVLFLLPAFVAGGPLLSDDLPQQYREPFAKSWPIRKQQHLQTKAYLDRLVKTERERQAASFNLNYASTSDYESALQPIRNRLELAYGFPPPKAIESPVARIEFVAEDQVARIYRCWTEVIEGVEAYALYMVPRKLEARTPEEKAPVIIAVHGGSGCPEAICDLDTRVNYRSFGHEAVKRGYIVYAPGILMAVSYADPPDPRIEGADYQALGKQAALLGISIRNLQIYQLIEGVKAVARKRPEADIDRIGMTGLSMGGSYTLATMPIWPAIKAGVSSAGFRVSIAAAADPQVETVSFGQPTSRATMVSLICPRPFMIQTGEADTVVPITEVRRGIPQARGYYERLGVIDRFEFNVHAGSHVFENGAIFRFFDMHLRM
jgi:dienelactone hydrolase